MDDPLAELTEMTIRPKTYLDRVSDAMTDTAVSHPEAPGNLRGIVLLSDGDTATQSVSFMNYPSRGAALAEVTAFFAAAVRALGGTPGDPGGAG